MGGKSGQLESGVAKTGVRSVAEAPAATTGKKASSEPASAAAGDGWLDRYLPYQLYRVTHRLNARLLTRLRAMKISTSQWRVLSVLKSHGTLSLTGIKDETLMEQPTVSRVVAQLEIEGLVTRTPSAEDSRITDVALTTAGVKAFEQIVPAARRHAALALNGLSEMEMEQFRALLARIEQNIDLDD